VAASVPLKKSKSLPDHFSLEQIQTWVGGYFEFGGGGAWAANEDGTARGMALNEVASKRAGVVLVGPVVFFVKDRA